MSIKLHQTITGTISEIDSEGSGMILGKHKPVHVHGTIPGEEVRVKTVRKIKHGVRAEIEEIVQPSPHRIKPLCPYAGQCGGCKWQHVDYVHQLELKRTLLEQAFAEQDIPFLLKTVEGCPLPFYYRNRMDYGFDVRGNLGLKEPGKWWSTLDLQSCFLLSEDGVEIMTRIRTWSRNSGLPFWDPKTGQGFFRYLVIREGKNTGERLVMIVTGNATDSEAAKALMEMLPELLGPLATSIVWGINAGITDLSTADEIRPIKGDPWIHEEVNGYRYRIHPNSFFQTNTLMAGRLQETVKELAGDVTDKYLLDLYCGSGFFSMAFAKSAKRIDGIEIDPDGIRAAKTNAELNGCQVNFSVGKVEDMDWNTIGIPDLVLLDPPRAGLHPIVIKTILQILPTEIIYVSCNYKAFVRELKTFLTAYEIVETRALDLFPHTPHVELVTHLRIKKQ